MIKCKTLIIVDMQNDFVTGSLAIPGAKDIVPGIKELINSYKTGGGYMLPNHNIIFTRDTHLWSYLNTHEGKYLPVPHCIKETPGWCIIDELAKESDAHFIINKSQFGCKDWCNQFEDFDFEPDSIDICRVATDICVISNAIILRSLYPKIDIHVWADLCRGTSPEKHEAALSIMESCHIDIIKGDDAYWEPMVGK